MKVSGSVCLGPENRMQPPQQPSAHLHASLRISYSLPKAPMYQLRDRRLVMLSNMLLSPPWWTMTKCSSPFSCRRGNLMPTTLSMMCVLMVFLSALAGSFGEDRRGPQPLGDLQGCFAGEVPVHDLVNDVDALLLELAGLDDQCAAANLEADWHTILEADCLLLHLLLLLGCEFRAFGGGPQSLLKVWK